MSDQETRAGMAAIVGLPNVGKSSLLNRLLDTKLAIVTGAAQTTRRRVVGIDTRNSSQIVFLDTPGLVEPEYLLHYAMLAAVRQAIADADVVVLLLDATRQTQELSEEIIAVLKRLGSRLIVAVNKVDTASKERRARAREWVGQHFAGEIEEVSAATGEGVESLRSRIAQRLPISPFLYPDDDLSTQTMRFFVEELIRETVIEQYRQEIPYSVAVQVEEFREDADPMYVSASIFVERASQKGVVIGEGGAAIRDLGTASRAKIEELVQKRIYLDLRVKVLPKWRKDPLQLKRFGFSVPTKNGIQDA